MDAIKRAYPEFSGENEYFVVDVMKGSANRNDDHWIFDRPRIPTIDYVKYAVQIYVDGNGASARLKTQLLTGSPVVV